MLLLVGLVFVATHLMMGNSQHQISYYEGKGYDGQFYFDVAEDFSRGEAPRTSAPWVYRIGTPYLASIVNAEDLFDGFFTVNMIANIITVLLLFYYLSIFIKNKIITSVLVSIFIMTWHTPVRLIYFYPVHVDHWAFVFMLIGLILVEKAKENRNLLWVILLTLSTAIGVFFREITILPAFIYLFATNPFKFQTSEGKYKLRKIKIPQIQYAIPFLFGLISLFIVHQIAEQSNSYSSLYTAFKWAFRKPLMGYILAWCIAFGPMIFIAVYERKNAAGFIRDKQHFAAFFISIFILSWIGGTDTFRFCYWSMPLVYILIANAIAIKPKIYKSVSVLMILIPLQLIAMRVFWILPDYPNAFPHKYPFLTVMSNEFPTWDLWTMHGDKFVNVVAFGEYFILGVILLLRFYLRDRKHYGNDKLIIN